MKFTELGLNTKILKALESFRFEIATQVQDETIPLILEGKDVTVRSETGSGKTLAYALPILQNSDKNADFVETLIICPTRELCLQVTDEFKKLVGFLENIKVVPVYGGSAIERQIQALKRKPQIVVGTPGRIMDHMERRTLKIDSLKTLVLDEADEMLNMGFKDDIERILKSTPKTRQTLLFSATYPESIKQITKNFQNNPTKIEIGVENRSLSSLTQHYVIVNKNSKKEALLEILNTKKPKLTIVFSNTKRMADIITKYLNENSHNAKALHGDLKQSQRKRVIDSVKAGETEILVASDVASRGLDINDVEYVINFDVPLNVEHFIHRIGRTARIGKNGNSMTIIASNLQLKTLKEYEKQTESNIQELNLSITEKASSPSQNDKNERPLSSGGFSRSRKSNSSRSRSFGHFNENKNFNRDRTSTQKNDRDKFSKDGGDKTSRPSKFDRNKNFSHKAESKPFSHGNNFEKKESYFKGKKSAEEMDSTEKRTRPENGGRSFETKKFGEKREKYGERIGNFGKRKDIGERIGTFGEKKEKYGERIGTFGEKREKSNFSFDKKTKNYKTEEKQYSPRPDNSGEERKHFSKEGSNFGDKNKKSFSKFDNSKKPFSKSSNKPKYSKTYEKKTYKSKPFSSNNK